jgi:hypothetical protein
MFPALFGYISIKSSPWGTGEQKMHISYRKNFIPETIQRQLPENNSFIHKGYICEKCSPVPQQL